MCLCVNRAISSEIFYRKSRMTRSENYYPTLVLGAVDGGVEGGGGGGLSVGFVDFTKVNQPSSGGGFGLHGQHGVVVFWSETSNYSRFGLRWNGWFGNGLRISIEFF